MLIGSELLDSVLVPRPRATPASAYDDDDKSLPLPPPQRQGHFEKRGDGAGQIPHPGSMLLIRAAQAVAPVPATDQIAPLPGAATPPRHGRRVGIEPSIVTHQGSGRNQSNHAHNFLLCP